MLEKIEGGKMGRSKKKKVEKGRKKFNRLEIRFNSKNLKYFYSIPSVCEEQ